MERYYETIFILRPTLNDQEIAETIESYKNLLVREGAEMIRQEDLGKKRLAYLIQHFQNGHYALFQYQAKPAAVAELERTFKISEDLLRYLTVRLDSKPAAVEAPAEPAAQPADAETSAEPAAQPAAVEAPAEPAAQPAAAEASAEPAAQPADAEASAEPADAETPAAERED